MAVPLTEAEAIARVLDGDDSAFSVLVSGHQDSAFRAAFLMLRDGAAAEDIAQEGFLRAYRNLHRFRTGEPFRPWLLRIVTNLALNEVRSRDRKTGLLARLAGRSAADVEQGAAAPESSVVEGEESRTVLRALERLNQDDRLVLYLRYFLEFGESETANALGVRPGTVKSRLHRAGRRLRQVIEREFPGLRENL